MVNVAIRHLDAFEIRERGQIGVGAFARAIQERGAESFARLLRTRSGREPSAKD
jgi:hypothetical protein